MEADVESLLAGAQAHALASLPFSERQSTNLHIDKRVIPAGTTVGPKQLQILTKQPSVLVYADTKPMANWGHDCRYHFYSAQTGDLVQTVPARLPPSLIKRPETLLAFHQPVQFLPNRITIPVRPPVPCPLLWQRTRYAILWSGASEKRHLNDLEFLYRTLIDRFGYDPDNIYALNSDGTLNTYDGIQTIWPGDGTPTGSRSPVQATAPDLRRRSTTSRAGSTWTTCC
jgi:hypothetical protein